MPITKPISAAPNLSAGMLAAFLFCCLLAAGSIFGSILARSHAYAAASQRLLLKTMGSALNRDASGIPDLLPVIGGSEVMVRRSKFQSSAFFKGFPTGFAPYEIARPGLTSLTMAEIVAALGPSLRDRTVVVSYTPFLFEVPDVNPRDFGRVYSPLNSYETLFGSAVPLPLRIRIAKRLLGFKETIKGDPLLRFSARMLVKDGALPRAGFYLSYPFGIATRYLLELQDRFLTAKALLTNPKLSQPPRRQPHPIDWKHALAGAQKLAARLSTNNPYGIQNRAWMIRYDRRMRGKPLKRNMDPVYLAQLKGSKEWGDFDILLSTLKACGAKAVIVGRPIKGAFYDARGISRKARETFYARVGSAVSRYGFPLVEFADFDSDLYFGDDRYPHTGPVGWVYINRVLDQVFHGAPLKPGDLS